MPESPLRHRLARILLWLAPVLVLAALPLSWTEGRDSVWDLFSDIVDEIVEGLRSGDYHPLGYFMGMEYYIVFLASLGTILFLSVVCPCFLRVIEGNAPLRWICRASSVVAMAAFLHVPWPSVGKMEEVERPFAGGVLLVLAAFSSAAGLCLLPGRKPAAPFIPSGAAAETPAVTPPGPTA